MSNTATPASVKLPGKAGRVDVTVPEGSTVADVLLAAADALGVLGNFDPESVVAVVNNEEADLQDAVPDGAQVDGTTNVANG